MDKSRIRILSFLVTGLSVTFLWAVFVAEPSSKVEQETTDNAAAVPPPPSPKQSAEELARARAEQDAAASCRRLFKNAATHPSTVNFPWIDDAYDLRTVDGVVHFRRSATAKNSFNLELRYVMKCSVRDGKIVGFDVVEAR